jgi:hypothetical protein
MNYQIIKDQDMLQQFIAWLPDLEEGETYYVSLLARSKYTDAVKSDKQQLKRFTSRKEDLFSKIRQLECPVGAYTQKGNPIPQEALAIYITPNPRSMYDATFSALTSLVKCIQTKQRNHNPHQEVMSEIQRSKSRSCFVDFDIDYKEDGYLDSYLKNWVAACTGPNAEVSFVETRGGFHILVAPHSIDAAYQKTWYQALAKHEHVDQTGDLLIPIPGCTQGDFSPILHQ